MVNPTDTSQTRRQDSSALQQRLLAALPQTQCRRCGYPDCAAYASALVQGAADINQCPPGGQQGIARLAELTGQSAKPLNPEYGLESPRNVMFIDEDWCIGCTLCLKACPVDAIVGANKLMHSVIEAYCTGCELCLPVCPVDCIQVENASGSASGWDAWSKEAAEQAKTRYARHQARIKQNQTSQNPNATPIQPDTQANTTPDKKHAMIEAVLARARARRSTEPQS